MASLAPDIVSTYLDDNGLPAAGWLLYTYAAGTSTPLATYTDSTEIGANTNPVVLDGSGRASVWITTASYKFVLTDPNGVVKITRDNIVTIPDGSITTAKIADDAVTTAKIPDNAITQAKMADSSVGTTEILDNAITHAKMADNSVGTAELIDANITQAKMVPKVPVVSSSCGLLYTNTTATLSDVTNLSVTITTLGGPVMLMLVPDGTLEGGISIASSSAGLMNGIVAILQGATVIGKHDLSVSVDITIPISVSSDAVKSGGGLATVTAAQSGPATEPISVTYPPGSIMQVDTPAAGTYTYKIQAAKGSRGTGTISLYGIKLMAFEI